MVRGLKVLIVDDQLGIRLLLTEYFKFVGWESVAASNGREALELLSENPDVVMLDLKMPLMDGFDCLAELRQTHPDLPVIVMTAYGELKLLESEQLKTVSAKLTKPFDVTILRDMVWSVYSRPLQAV